MRLQFLKLGGSLITDKTHPYTARPEMLDALVGEIVKAFRDNADLHLVLVHGSGSFGLAAASSTVPAGGFLDLKPGAVLPKYGIRPQF
jgi:isopentenyl phosphate kinase